MKLYVHEAGVGPRSALLVHGVTADHHTWHAVIDRLVPLGYRVYAVDLRGHGRSPRGAATAEEYADDLVESVPVGLDLAIGHSLGGLVLLRAVDRLRPGRAVYSDPAFCRPITPPPGADDRMRARLDAVTEATLRVERPQWSDAAIAAELAALARFDRDAVSSFAHFSGGPFTPGPPVVPSLVQLADPSDLVPPESAALLAERGFDVVTVPGTGHCIHIDDLDGFMESIRL